MRERNLHHCKTGFSSGFWDIYSPQSLNIKPSALGIQCTWACLSQSDQLHTLTSSTRKWGDPSLVGDATPCPKNCNGGQSREPSEPLCGKLPA